MEAVERAASGAQQAQVFDSCLRGHYDAWRRDAGKTRR